MFEEKEINEYLKHITKMTYGHPLSLSIIRELWHQEGGKPLSNDPDSIAAFQLKFDKKVATDFVEERILKRLIPTPTLKKLTEYGALLRSFNRPQLGDVFSDLLPELKVDDVFDQFVSYPYIEFKGDYRYTFHEFVRERLARYTQEGHLKEWRAYHKKALDSFTPGVGIPEGAPYLPEWYYHLIGFKEIEGMKEWKEAIQKAKNSENNENRKSLLLIARDKALNLTLTSQLTCTEEEEQFYKDIGEREKAVERHDHAEFLRMEIKRLREKARGLEARGDDQRQYGDLSVALESYKEALQLFQHIGNHSEGEDRLQNVIDEIEEEIKLLREKVVELGAKGRDQRERGDLGAALESYKEALQLLQRIGNHPVDEARLQHVITEIEKEIEYLIEKARELEARGDDRRPYGDLGAALESYKEALQLFQQVSNHAEDVARLQRAVDEIEQQLEALTTTTNDNETISSASIPDPTGIGALTNRKILHVPLSLLRRRPLLTASIFLLLIVLLFLLIFTPILQTIIPNHISFQPPPGIGITQSSNGQSIGISNGTYTFNSNCQTDNALKCQAAEKLRQGDINEAKSLWNRELATNANDAEALIYLEDQRVQNSPHITLVVATTLTGSPADLGQDNLQGAYIAQKEFNDGFKLPHGLKVFLLIANFGSNPKDATTVAKQIVQAAQADKTIVGVMGLPLGSYVPDAIAVLQQAQLPLVSPTASGDGLTGISPFFFRIVPPDQVQASVGANYAVQALHAHTVAIFYDPQDSSNKGLAKGFERDFTDLGGIARENTYTTGQPETLRSQLQDMSGNLPDLLYFAGSATDMNTVLVNLPPSSNLQIMGGDSLYQLQDYSTIPRSALTHLYFTAFAYPDEWNNLCSNGLSQVCFQPSFFASYSQSFNYGRHQEQPYGYGRANSDTIVSYDALSVLLTAYQRLSQGQTLQVALKELTGDQAFQGVSGQISFGTDGNPLNKAVVLLSLRPDGDVQLASTSGIQGCFLINTCTNP